MAGKRQTGGAATVPSGNLAEAFRALAAELRGDEETPEAGFLTKQQWMRESALSEAQLQRILRKAIDKGKVEMRKYRVKTASGMVRPIEHYRINAQADRSA